MSLLKGWLLPSFQSFCVCRFFKIISLKYPYAKKAYIWKWQILPPFTNIILDDNHNTYTLMIIWKLWKTPKKKISHSYSQIPEICLNLVVFFHKDIIWCRYFLSNLSFLEIWMIVNFSPLYTVMLLWIRISKYSIGYILRSVTAGSYIPS